MHIESRSIALDLSLAHQGMLSTKKATSAFDRQDPSAPTAIDLLKRSSAASTDSKDAHAMQRTAMDDGGITSLDRVQQASLIVHARDLAKLRKREERDRAREGSGVLGLFRQTIL